MRDFERPKTRLGTLSFHAKLVYGVFLLFTLAGVAETLFLAHDMVRLNGAELSPYYAGDAAVKPGSAEPSKNGPLLELPSELFSENEYETQMSRRKLLEVTHFHLFSIPVYLLILSHLFMMTSAAAWVRSAWILTATFASALHIAAPWLVRERLALSSVVYGVSGFAMALSYTWMILRTTFEMMFRNTKTA